jgi:hypothetical protein
MKEHHSQKREKKYGIHAQIFQSHQRNVVFFECFEAFLIQYYVLVDTDSPKKLHCVIMPHSMVE